MIEQQKVYPCGVVHRDLHKEIAEEYGVPEAPKSGFFEIIQFYHWGDYGPIYHVFDPHEEIWTVWGDSEQLVENEIHKDLSPDAKLKKAIDELKYLAPPVTSGEASASHLSEPFVCKGWLFCWEYIDKSCAWKLKPIREL